MPWITLVMRANAVLKQRDAVLVKVRDNMTQETRVELRRTSVYISSELMPSSQITMVSEKLNRVLHDEAIQKAVSFEEFFSASLAKTAVFSGFKAQGFFQETV